MGSTTTLHWDEATLAAMHDAVRRAYPDEACGFLLGLDRRVSGVRIARNVADHPRRAYVAHPEDVLAAFEEARAKDVNVLGVFHSHPDGKAELSATDLAIGQAGWIYVVIATRGAEPSDMTVTAL